MPRRGRITGWNATALLEPETTTRDAESVKTASTGSPTESEIAAVAYQLWVENGCPVGSDQEDWFRAKAMIEDALDANCDESEILVEFRWEGHWEAWESEWGGARWIWDSGRSTR